MSNTRRTPLPRGHDLVVLLDFAERCGLIKQETPWGGSQEVSTDQTTLTEVPGGCSPECA